MAIIKFNITSTFIFQD